MAKDNGPKRASGPRLLVYVIAVLALGFGAYYVSTALNAALVP